MRSKYKNIIYNKLIYFFGESKTDLIIRYKQKLMNYVFNIQKSFLRNILLFVGFKKVIFKPYDLINIKNDFPAIIFHRFNGITFIGKKNI